MDLTQEQIDQLKSLGINVDGSQPVKEDIKPTETESSNLPEPQPIPEIPNPAPETPLSPISEVPPVIEIVNDVPPVQENSNPPTADTAPKKSNNVFPLLSISGLTILSFGGLVLLKGKGSETASVPVKTNTQPSSEITPTQVPKSIQHYLLTSQQYFSQAVQQQTTSECPENTCNRPDTIELLNNSIIAATEAIKEFPNDYRGYQQRASIYQSLTTSKPDLIDQSITDFATAYKLNSSSAEITRSLASLYAQKGDANKTIFYLRQTVSLEPTKAQNFYDLATIQQQAGLLVQALDTYNKLIPLITDPAQKTAVESQKSSIEQIIAQNPNKVGPLSGQDPTDLSNSATGDLSPSLESPTLQASLASNLIIAAPEKDESIKVTNQTDSNSLAGNAILTSGQKEISISNDNVSSTSQVYVTATKGGKNQNLQVTSKSDKSFTVGLDSALTEDVEFKWWIIN